MLLRWFRTRYPEVEVPEETIQATKSSASWSTHDKISGLLLNLARKHHAEGRMDEDLQVALGVLFYSVGEYNRAQDCFSTALTVRPKVRVTHINHIAFTHWSLGLPFME